MATERQQRVAEQFEDEVILLYTREGLTFRAIAEHLGKDVKAVHSAWKRGRARYADQAAKHHGMYITQQLSLIDTAIEGLVPKVNRGEPRAVEVLMKVLDRQARLLGLDAPMKASVTVTDEMTARVKALAEELAGLDS